MTTKINSITLDKEEILDRVVEVSDQVQSIKVNPSDGTFFACYPLLNNGTIIHYPQNPKNSDYSSTTIKSVEVYGDLNFCLDVGVDLFGQKLWIADAGNNKIVVLNLIDNTIIREISDFILPHSIIVNPLNRNVFVKSLVDNTTQKLTHMDDKGNILWEFEFPGIIPTTNIGYTAAYLQRLPKAHTMDFDSNLKRLWFVGESVLYMLDLDTKQIITQDLQDFRLYNISSVSIDRTSGNAFVVIDDDVNYYVQQIYKDNNVVFGTAYLEEQDLEFEI